jgi:hypothetical protein
MEYFCDSFGVFDDPFCPLDAKYSFVDLAVQALDAEEQQEAAERAAAAGIKRKGKAGKGVWGSGRLCVLGCQT